MSPGPSAFQDAVTPSIPRADSPGQAPQLCEQALEPLPKRVRRIPIETLEIFAIGSLQFELNQKIQLRFGQIPSGHAAVQKVTELGVPFERLFDCEREFNASTI